jgi:hypothetical protein
MNFFWQVAVAYFGMIVVLMAVFGLAALAIKIKCQSRPS